MGWSCSATLQQQLRQVDLQRRRQRRWLLAAMAGLTALLLTAAALGASWADALLLPNALLLALLTVVRPLPLLTATRRQRGVDALAQPLVVLERAQRLDDLEGEPGLRDSVVQAILASGREVVDLVNDSLSGRASGPPGIQPGRLFSKRHQPSP